MKELRNVIDDENFKRLQKELFSSQMPWYLSGTYTSTKYPNLIDIDAEEAPNFSYSHLVYINEQPLSDLYEPISKIIWDGLEKMGEKPKELLRIKVNMSTNQPNVYIHEAHVDFDEHHTSGLIYINTTNGPTTIYNEKYDSKYMLSPEEYLKKILNNKLTIKEKIECEENKMMIFDGRYYHSSSVQSDTYRRIVINFNYKKV